MAIAVAVPSAWGHAARDDDDSDLAATVVLLDGRREVWRDARLIDDPDVADWEQRALNQAHPDYASLFWAELETLRGAHR